MQHLQMLQQENPAMAKQFVQSIQALDPGTSPQPSPQGGEGDPAGGVTETLSLSPGVVAGAQGSERMGGGVPGAAGRSAVSV